MPTEIPLIRSELLWGPAILEARVGIGVKDAVSAWTAAVENRVLAFFG